MGRRRVASLPSLEATLQFGKDLAQIVPPNAILAISGDLGAGKTSLVQGIAQGLGITDPIQSPTFVYLNLYEGARLSLYHFDLYRLPKPADFIGLGFDEYFTAGGICAIEWPEKAGSLLPETAIHIQLIHTQGGGREIHFDLYSDLLSSTTYLCP